MAACVPPPLTTPEATPTTAPLADRERYYAIWLGGARIGTAHEREQWSSAGVLLVRSEAMRYLRGSALVEISTTIEIAADRMLVPSRVTWREQAQRVRHGEAIRDARGWLVRDDDGARRLPGDAIPAELSPLWVRRDGRFAGAIFLPARGFVGGSGRIDPVAPDRLIARLALANGTLAEATIDLSADGMPTRVVDGEGVLATRISAGAAAAVIAPVDVIAATSLALPGPPSAARRIRLISELELPGELPPGPRGGDLTDTITSLAARVHRQIVPDLAAAPRTTRNPAAARAGDCTTFALAYAALATARGIPTRIVTGFLVDGARLVRHRWAISWTGRRWLSVDASSNAVPAGGDLISVAVHGADDAGLMAGEAALTRVRAAAWE